MHSSKWRFQIWTGDGEFPGDVHLEARFSVALVTQLIFGWEELIGFSLPILLSIPYSFYSAIRLSSDVELLMVSADLVLKYCKLIQESPVLNFNRFSNALLICHSSTQQTSLTLSPMYPCMC